MKRKRGEEEDKTNHFFPMILLQPELLVIIFDSLGDERLTLFKILYQYFKNNNDVMTVMDDYVEENIQIEKLSAILFRIKVNELQYLVSDGDMDEYCYKLNEYKKFRHLKNFVKYGYCYNCHKLPQRDIFNLIDVTNRNIIELESKHVYLCEKCNGKEVFYTTKQLIDKLDADYLTKVFANKYGIRHGYTTLGLLRFLIDDVNNIHIRQSAKREMKKKR